MSEVVSIEQGRQERAEKQLLDSLPEKVRALNPELVAPHLLEHTTRVGLRITLPDGVKNPLQFMKEQGINKQVFDRFGFVIVRNIQHNPGSEYNLPVASVNNTEIGFGIKQQMSDGVTAYYLPKNLPTRSGLLAVLPKEVALKKALSSAQWQVAARIQHLLGTSILKLMRRLPSRFEQQLFQQDKVPCYDMNPGDTIFLDEQEMLFGVNPHRRMNDTGLLQCFLFGWDTKSGEMTPDYRTYPHIYFPRT